MALRRMGDVHQIRDGFVVYLEGKLYYVDNDFRVINEFNFRNFEAVTLGGLAVKHNQGNSHILDVISGEERNIDRYVQVSYDRQDLCFRNLTENYDFETDLFYDNLSINCTNNRVNFYYGKNYISDIKDDFDVYYYKNSKSILVYPNKIKVYEGEIYPLERLEDSLHGKEKAHHNKEYGRLIAAFKLREHPYTIKVTPNHIIFLGLILDVENVDLYKCRMNQRDILGIIDDTIIGRLSSSRYKLEANKIESTYQNIYQELLDEDF